MNKNNYQISIKGEREPAIPLKTIVLGVGNELLSDEGVGVHVAKALTSVDLPPNVEVFEGGTDGFGLLNIILEADRLIVIDSLKGGAEPGSIYKFNIDEAPSCPDVFKTSVHQIGILEVIHLSDLIGKSPRTTIIGIEPKKLGTGMDLSPQIEQKIPRVVKLVMEELHQYA